MNNSVTKFTAFLFFICLSKCGQVYSQASFTSSPAAINNTLTLCSGSQILFTNTTPGNENTINWIFPGGNPGNANTTGPHIVTFANSGTFTVSLSVNGSALTTMQVVIQASTPSPNLNILLDNGCGGSFGTSTYNNVTYFTSCASSFLGDQLCLYSSTTSTNLSSIHTVNWGDGTSNTYTGTNIPVGDINFQHGFGNTGTSYITYLVQQNNTSCIKSQILLLYTGANPTATISPGGVPTLCNPGSVVYNILPGGQNTPGTTYTIDVNDGGSYTYSHPPPATVTHNFSMVSCGTNSVINSVTYLNSFQVSITCANACGSSSSAIGPINIQSSPDAQMTTVPLLNPYNNNVCQGSNVTFNDVSIPGTNINVQGNTFANPPIPPYSCNNQYKRIWKLYGPSGPIFVSNSNLTISGSIGSGSSSSVNLLAPGSWSNGAASINLTFLQPGNYKIVLYVGGLSYNPCGIDSTVTNICVTPDFQVNITSPFVTACAPAIGIFQNNSTPAQCNLNNVSAWTVTPSNPQNCGQPAWFYNNNTNAQSLNASVAFTGPGVYIVELQNSLNSPVFSNTTTLGCQPKTTTAQITIKAPPVITLPPTFSFCEDASFNPSATVNNCYGIDPLIFAWNFNPNNDIPPANQPNPLLSDNPNPGIIYPQVGGPFPFTVSVTNECGTTIANSTITITAEASASISYVGSPFCTSITTPQAVTQAGTTGGSYSSTTGLNINASTGAITPSLSIPGIYTVTYTVAASGGCAAVITTGTITVTPLNTIAAGTSQTICLNTAIATITLATTGATGATFSGLPAGVTGSWAGNVATISGTPTTAVGSPFNYTVTLTGGCGTITSTGTITVNAANTIAAGTSQTVCLNAAIATITIATTGATGATFSGLPAGVTGSWAGNVATISGTPTTTVGSPFTYNVTTTGGCLPQVSASGIITVTPLNTIAAGTSQTICLNTAIATITIATTGATGATFSGLPAGVTGSWAGNVATISGTPTTAVGSPFNYTVTLTGGCGTITSTGTITVNAANTIAAGTSQTVCLNAAIATITIATTGATGATFSGLPAGVTGSWAGNVATISGTPTTAVGSPFNYTVTLTGGCGTITSTGTITVNAANTIAAGTSQTVCLNAAIATITIATTGATGATFSGLPAGVTGSWAGNVATISGTPTTTVGSPFTYNVTTTGGCLPQVSASGIITVTPLNTIAAGTSQTICLNTAIATITLATTGATGATFSGLPAGVTGSWAGNVATISGTPTTAVGSPFNYTVTLTGGCGTITSTGTITVNAANTIAAGTSQTVCLNAAIATITIATTGATGATFSGLPAGVTGSWAGNVATISGTPTTTVGSPFTYNVTTTGGCLPQVSASGIITVTPLNTIAAGTSQTICLNTAIATITLATTGATGATFSGLPAGVTGSWAGNVATISGTPTTAVGSPFNYTVTLTGGCGTITSTGTITVNAANTIAAGTSQTVCLNTAIATITLATTGATGATFSGLPAGVTGSWAGNVATISGTPTTAVGSPFNYTVTLTGGCGTVTSTGTITVNATNTIAAGTSQTVCLNAAIATITIATTGATGATFSGLPAGVTGSWAGNVATISGTPTTTVGSPFTYNVTTTGGCLPQVSASGIITVTPLNTIAAGTSQTICLNTAIATITLATTGATGATFSGLPAGVTGSWAGNVATISGTPTTAVGSPFNYTVTLTGGCGTITSTGTITVNAANTIAAGTSQTVCLNAAIATITIATTGATGATFSGLPAGVAGSWAGNVATISGTPTTTVGSPFTYNVTTTGGCLPQVSASGIITVTPLNTIATGTSQTVCLNAAIATITIATTGATGATFSGLPAGVTGSWAGNVATISGTPTTTVGSPFTYNVTTTGGCLPQVSASGIITVNQNTIAAGTSQTICLNTAIATITLATTGATGATFSGLPAGVTGSWAGNVATISGTPTTAVGSPFNYTVTLTGGCGTVTSTGTITVNATNTIAAGTSQTVCLNAAIATITIATTGATGATFSGLPAGVTGSWAGNVATISGTPTTTVGSPFTYNVTTTGGCLPQVSASGIITVTPLNTIAAGTSQTICLNTAIATITLATTGATGATFSGLPAGVTGSWAGNVATISGTPTTAVGSPFNYTVTLTGGCGTITSTGTITVNAANTIAAGTSQTVCLNAAIATITIATTGATGATFSGLPAGVAGSWAGNVATISGTPTTTVGSPFTYNVTTTGGCLPQVSASGIITVTPLNTIATGTSQTVCLNAAIATITIATTGATGATFSGLPAGVTGSWAGNVANISGTPTTTVGSPFTYNVTTTGGCLPQVSASGIITVNQNTIVAGTSQTICINTAITPITLATTGATGATFSGLPAGVTGSWVGNEVTISGTPAANGPFTYTVTTTGGCGTVTSTGTITVNPEPVVSDTLFQNICSNNILDKVFPPSFPVLSPVWYYVNNLAFIGTVNIAGGQPITSNGAQIVANAYPNTASQDDIFLNLGSSTATVIYNVTPISDFGCIGSPFYMSVEILPNTISIFVNGDSINDVDSILVCSGECLDLNLTSNSSLTPIWRYIPSIPLNNNLLPQLNPSVQFSSTISSCLTNTVNATQHIEYEVRFINSSDPTACPSLPDTIHVFVLPEPTITPIADTVLCHYETINSIPVNINIGTINWFHTGDDIGLPYISNTTLLSPNEIPGFTSINNGTSIETLIVHLLPSYTEIILPSNISKTCNGIEELVQITVNPIPSLNPLLDSIILCPNVFSNAIQPSGPIIGSSYTWVNNWTNSNSSISLAPNGTGTIPTFFGINNNSNAVESEIIVTPTFTTNSTSCYGEKDTIIIKIRPMPNVINNDTIICSGENTNITLQSDSPSSFEWYADPNMAVLNETSSPIDTSINILDNLTLLGSVQETVQYHVIPTSIPTYYPIGCEGPETIISVTLNPLPIVDFIALNPPYCDLNPISFQNLSNGIYDFNWDFGDGSANSYLTDPTHQFPSIGSFDVQLNAENDNTGCSDSIIKSIIISPSPDANFTYSDSSACDFLDVTYIASSANPIWNYLWDFGNGDTIQQIGSIGYQFDEAGCYDVSLTVTNNQGCSNTETYLNIACVFESPTAIFNADPINQSVVEPLVNFYNFSQNATSYEWNFGDGTYSFAENTNHSFPGESIDYLVVLTAFNEVGCSDTAAIYIHVGFILYVPNSFTPNDDERNQDFLPIITSGYKLGTYRLNIYNRWGENVFESYDPNFGWDGTYGQSGINCEIGTYTYVIELEVLQNQEIKKFIGHVNLIR